MAKITEFPFVAQIEDEALALLLEAHGDLSAAARSDEDLDPVNRLLATRRNFEVTARLSWVVAWVFYQKAVRAGELTQAEAQARHPALELPNDPVANEASRLPDAVLDRLNRSRALYDRALGLGAECA